MDVDGLYARFYSVRAHDIAYMMVAVDFFSLHCIGITSFNRDVDQCRAKQNKTHNNINRKRNLLILLPKA